MAKKVLKTRIQFTSTLQKPLYAALKEKSADTQVPISRLLDEAVTALLEERTTKK